MTRQSLIKLIYINVDGKEIEISTTVDELDKDFWGDCLFVPSNDDEVRAVELDGIDITTHIKRIAYKNVTVFLDVMKHLYSQMS